MERRERGFLGRLLVFIMSFMAVIGLIAMTLSVVNPYINPQQFVWTSFFGLSFWMIFIYNVLVLFLLVLLWSRKAWIAVLALLISIPGFNKSFSFGNKAKADDSFRIMSYNVHFFSDINKELNKEEFANQVMDIVREQAPDVFCCQEFQTFNYNLTRPQCIDAFAEGINFPYVYYNKNTNYGGNVIFSKYPIEKVTEDSGFGKENLYGVMVSVDAGKKGKFHVANVHLLSYNITDDELDILTNPSDLQNNLDTVGKSVLKKLSYGIVRRSEEIDRMLGGMPTVEGPVIVCGDFNETPLSYIYRKMQKAGYVDAFTKVGRGIKPTYARKLPLLRIDYIWANPEAVPLNFERYRLKASDHYPIILDFSIHQQTNTEQL